MKLSRQEIESKRTGSGGYTKKQLAEWGISWPPQQGWKKRLIEGSGKEQERYLDIQQKHRIHETKDLFDSECSLCQKTAKDRIQSFWSDGE